MSPVDPKQSHARPWKMACLLVAALLALTPVLIGGCGGGESESKNEESAAEDMAEEKASAETARSAAEAKNASVLATTKWQSAVKTFEKADGLVEDGKLSSAARYYKRAKSRFEDAGSEAVQNQAKHAQLVKKIAEYEKLRTEAEALNAAKIDADGWKYVETQFAQAKEAIEAGQLNKAKRPLNRAISDMQGTIRSAKEKQALLTEIQTLQAQVAEYKQKAVDAKAEDLAADDMLYAGDEVRAAEKAIAKFDYRRALDSLQKARNVYASAASGAKRGALTGASGADDAGGFARRTPDSEGGLDGGDRRTPAPALGEIEVPDGGGDDGGIDLSSGILDLFAVSPEYQNGVIKLEYGLGVDFRKDADIKVGGEFMHFEGSDNVGFGIEDYVIAGNTKGLVFLNCGFEDGAMIEFDVQVQLCLPNSPFFRVIVMAEGSKSYYASNFGTNVQIFESGRAPKQVPSRVAKYNQAPGKWTNKREPVHIKVKYRKSNEDEKGVIQTWYDGEECCSLKTDKYRKGRVGLAWHNVKFYVTNLTVKGYLDEDWAREALAKGPRGDDAEEEDDFDF